MNKEFQDALKDYSEAVQNNIVASQEETLAKEKKRAAYHKVIIARENLRSIERDILSSDCNFEKTESLFGK